MKRSVASLLAMNIDDALATPFRIAESTVLSVSNDQQRRFAGAGRCRRALVAILGSLALFVICSLSLGYTRATAPACWGIVEEVGTELQVPFDSRLTASAQYVLLSVTDSGAAIGLQAGDVIDTTQWTISERLAFVYPTTMQASKASYERRGQAIASWHSADSLPDDVDPSRLSDVALRSLLLCSGLLIIRYGHGHAAVAAGVYLASIAMADKPTMTFAGLPPFVQTSALVIATLSRLVAYAARFIFAIELLRPSSRPFLRAMFFPFAALWLLVLVCDFGRVAGILIGTPPVLSSVLVLPVAQICMQVYSIGIFAGAALLVPAAQRFATTIIFAATLLTIAAYIIQECLLVMGQAAPAWANWYFNSGLLFVGIGYPWAILARRIDGVDFIVSRGVAYAIAIGLVVVAVNVLEAAIEQGASGWTTGILLDYGVPVVLGLSFNWIQGRFTLLLTVLLDREMRNAEHTLDILKAEMAQALRMGDIADRICHDVAHLFGATHVAVYEQRRGPFHILAGSSIFGAPRVSLQQQIPAHDPAVVNMQATLASVELGSRGSVLERGLLLPLAVLGKLVGVLHCGARTHDRNYDSAERAILEEFARELAVALVYHDPSLL